jgi:DUF4097 and DUF4098 domain-containing protein YvlB
VAIDSNHSRIEVSDAGNVRLNNTTGDLAVESASGAVSLNTSAGHIIGNGLHGHVTAESVGGTVTLRELTGASVRVTTTGGDIHVTGTPGPDGVYDVASQSGAVTLQLPASFSAQVTYGTVRGQVRTNLPEDRSIRSADGRVSVRVGTGSARIDVITFSGDIAVWQGRSTP